MESEKSKVELRREYYRKWYAEHKGEKKITVPKSYDIEYRKNRAMLFERLSSFLTGTICIGVISKLGAMIIGFIAPFVIAKIRIFMLSL